jgi:hypothetical protein
MPFSRGGFFIHKLSNSATSAVFIRLKGCTMYYVIASVVCQLAVSCPAFNFLIPRPIFKLFGSYVQFHKAVCRAHDPVPTSKVKVTHQYQSLKLTISCPAYNFLIP